MKTRVNETNRLKEILLSRKESKLKIPRLDDLLKKNKLCTDSDVVLLDSSIINFDVFFSDRDYNTFEEYDTSELQHVHESMEFYFDFVKNENIFFTQKVFNEIEQLWKIISFRLKKTTIPNKKRTTNPDFRFRVNNYQKALLNKELYTKIQETSFRIHKLSKIKCFEPKENDFILFNIVDTISSYRKLKENKIPTDRKFSYERKHHDEISKTDEWLVAQAYNKLLFENKNVTLLSNDDDIARILIDVQYYFNSPYLKKAVPKLQQKLRDNYLLFGNPKRKVCETKLNKKELYDDFGYAKGSKHCWKRIYKKISEPQDEFIKKIL